MACIRFNLTPQLPLTDLCTLAKWYQIENDHLVEQAPESSQLGEDFIVFFGAQANTQFLQYAIEFVGETYISAVSLYQPAAQLAPALAFDVKAQFDDLKAYKKQLSSFAAKHGFEGAYLSKPASLSQPGLLIMDMDSTAIEIECIDEIARLADVYDEVANVTAMAMAGQLGFSESLYQRVAKLEGIELSLIQQLKDNLPLMKGIQELCHTLKAHNWQLVLASGGFTWFAEALQKPLSLDAFYANELEIKDACLTGKVLGDVVDAQKKADILAKARTQLGLAKQQTIAIGDGANDLVMMAEAGTGVAIHGKPKVVENADAAICHGSLLQLLYFISLPE
ncbi:phosphoserine phosphatase SerB [Pseudoalteromonas phenolica]|uniref:Phosphoserine phosphatase n=1 Tax=Pseudoalteromonas phenolica TaxID=161398 RepID=A0A5S3YUJ4_9GAMM|nr:phosphoserine phosphatase SerB [Pseudoalteromonas phenolica]TMP81383.1 phosphoserine phosphatase SerB [Pseudoalteromonas phenolica]